MIKIEKVTKYKGVYSDEKDDYTFTIISDDWIEWDNIIPENQQDVETEILKEYNSLKNQENEDNKL